MSLTEVLKAREERWLKKCALSAEKTGAVVSLTLRMPASLRNAEMGKAFCMLAAAKAENVFSREGFLPERKDVLNGADGPCVLWVLKGKADDIKLCAISFEEEMPEGELIDIDVMFECGEELSRSALGKGSRRCIVCQRENARECIHEKRHTREETEKTIEEKMKNFL